MTQARDLADGKFDTDTLVVDAADNSVGIGTTSLITASGRSSLTLSTAAEKGELHLQNRTATTSSDAGILTYYNGSNRIGAIQSTADGATDKGKLIFMALDGGSTAGRMDLTEHGLTFNGDAAEANALDDYEEGQWVPGISTGTISSAYAYYTKIGNLVTVNLNVHTISDRTSTNNFAITGLPYTSSSNNRAIGAVMHRYIDDTAEDVTAWVEANVSSLKFYLSSQSGNWAQLRHTDFMSASAQIYMTISYQAA